MNNLFINPDGAGSQAQAVLAYIRGRSGVECSWSKVRNCYEAEPEVNRWHNGREQGYVISMRGPSYTGQVNIAFFEHRNSDSICVLEFEAYTMNPPTLSDIPEGMYKDKYDVTKSFEFGKAFDVADWICDRLEYFWSMEAKKQQAGAQCD